MRFHLYPNTTIDFSILYSCLITQPLICFSIKQNGGGEFDWDAETQGLILGCFFYGYALSHVPGGLLAERYGGKWLMGEFYLEQKFYLLGSPKEWMPGCVDCSRQVEAEVASNSRNKIHQT